MGSADQHEVFFIVAWGTFLGTIGVITIILLVPSVAGSYDTYNATSELYVETYGVCDFVHTLDNKIVFAYVNSDSDLMIAYRTPLNSTYVHHEVVAVGTYSTLNWDTCGVYSTHNGTIVVVGRGTTNTDSLFYIFMKWPSSDWDTWTHLLAATMTVGNINRLYDADINDTDHLVGVVSVGAGAPMSLFYFIVDVAGRTVETGAGGGNYGVTMNTRVYVASNISGRFHFLWQGNDGNTYFRDLDKTLGQVTVITSGDGYPSHLACLNNDIFIATGSLSTTYPKYWYQPTHQAASWTAIRLDPSTGSWQMTVSPSISSNSTSFKILAYDNFDETLYLWSSAWNASQTAWQDSMTDTGHNDLDYLQPMAGAGSLWPIHNDTGIKFTRIKSGWSMNMRDEDGATDESRLYYNSTTWQWWSDLTTNPPSITTTTLDHGTYGTSYSFIMSATDGTIPYTWAILVGPAWLSINSSTGELYGDPPTTNSWSITIQMYDDVPRYDSETYTLTVDPDTSGIIGGGSWATWWGPTCLSSVVIGFVIVAIFAWGALQIISRN